MIVFQSSQKSFESIELGESCASIGTLLFPLAQNIQSGSDDQFFCLILKDGNQLIRLELHGDEVTEQSFERLLRATAALESKRKELNDPDVKEIHLCLVAPGFHQNFAKRIRFHFPRVHLYLCSLIESSEREAIMLQSFEGGTRKKSEAKVLGTLSGEMVPSQNLWDRELSTQEVIDLANFGRELRAQRVRETLN
jgi:hypothetical protein